MLPLCHFYLIHFETVHKDLSAQKTKAEQNPLLGPLILLASNSILSYINNGTPISHGERFHFFTLQLSVLYFCIPI